MIERRIAAMHKRFGTNYALCCKDCNHLICGEYHGRRYYKCEIYGLSHSESSDWRRSWMACGMYNVPQDMDRWVPLMKQINHSRMAEPPIEGQIRIEPKEG
jgi:hypothetical protein